MADTWPVNDPLERGSGGIAGFFKGLAGAVGAGAANGFGLGDAASGMAGQTAQGQTEAKPFFETVKRNATDAVLGQYPGYGDLWTYDTAGGLDVTEKGWIVLGVAAVGIWLVLFSGGR